MDPQETGPNPHRTASDGGRAMALATRFARLSVALLGLSFASCEVESVLGARSALSRQMPRARRFVQVAASRVPERPLPEAAPTPGGDPNGETQPASFETGDVLAEPAEAEEGGSEAAAPGPEASVDAELALAATSKETFVYASPSWRAKKIGYLRGGAIVKRSPEPVGDGGCAGGWYRIAPQGFVCVGKNATLDVNHPLVTASARRPDRHAALPYAYGMSAFPTPPFYTKVPSPKEQRLVEQDLGHHARRKPDPAWDDVPFEPIPELIAGGRQVMSWNGVRHSSGSLYLGRAVPKSGFAFLDFFEHEGRRFGLSVDLDVIPLDRMRRVAPSAFHGLSLDAETTLPVVFVMTKGAQLYSGDPRSTGLVPVRPLGYREALAVTPLRVRRNGVGYAQTKSGEWLREDHLVRVEPMRNRPGWATDGRTWVDVSILKQVLVAYEGQKPVYVTLVSTGADGLGDPKETHSTVRGQFLIHTKHVTATMSGDELGDEFDLRDVPYVQYFQAGYAFHAAYWHDSFGRPRSHGCVNLSPLDARWLFHWTDPPVPQGWHGAMSLRQGTLVHIHP